MPETGDLVEKGFLNLIMFRVEGLRRASVLGVTGFRFGVTEHNLTSPEMQPAASVVQVNLDVLAVAEG